MKPNFFNFLYSAFFSFLEGIIFPVIIWYCLSIYRVLWDFLLIPLLKGVCVYNFYVVEGEK